LPVVRSKICGITRVEDALVAAEAGADAIGLVFYAKSPRAVTVAQARAIIDALPPFVTTVGLFVDAERDELGRILDALPLDLKALRVRPGDDIGTRIEPYASAAGILLDTYVPGVPGGTGEAFDWSLVPAGLAKPIVLAGGLGPENVAAAIARVRPYGVDVSGGVEASKGIKDAEKVRSFVRAVRAA
jgi:phosphoribosylanthranilate isomerase